MRRGGEARWTSRRDEARWRLGVETGEQAALPVGVRRNTVSVGQAFEVVNVPAKGGEAPHEEGMAAILRQVLGHAGEVNPGGGGSGRGCGGGELGLSCAAWCGTEELSNVVDRP